MTERPKANPMIRAFVDYAGLLAWLAAYLVTRDLLKATWVLVGVSAFALALNFAVERRIAFLPLLAGGAAVVFGLMTVVFKDPSFIKMKPTIVNLALSVALLGGAALGKNPLKALMGDAFKMSDAGWRRLGVRYGIFFACVAVLNEFVWRTQPDAVWVVFRMPGLPLLAAVFAVTQVPSMMKEAKALEIAARAAETQD